MQAIAAYGISCAVAYLLLVRLLRHRRINSTVGRHLLANPIRNGATGQNPADYQMTPAEAQQIIRVSALWDAPFVVEKSLEFALFKTYGIVRRIISTYGLIG